MKPIPVDERYVEHVPGMNPTSESNASVVNPLYVDWSYAPFHYSGAPREAILQMKYRAKVKLGEPLGHALATHLQEDLLSSDCPRLTHPVDQSIVVPVPLHPKRYRWRGFNQSDALAKAVAQAVHADVLLNCLVRTRNTQPQARLGAKQRAENVKGAFAIRNSASVIGKHVIVADDVMTTMYSVDDCARALKEAGAVSVGVVAVARD
jgi:ComF family protein